MDISVGTLVSGNTSNIDYLKLQTHMTAPTSLPKVCEYPEWVTFFCPEMIQKDTLQMIGMIGNMTGN